MDEQDAARFLQAIQGHRFESVYLVTLFTGMRRGEVLGLTWDCVDFGAGTITVNKQLQSDTKDGRKYSLVSTKNSKGRIITPAPDVMKLLKEQRRRQAECQIKAGPAWDNGWNLVFTNELGSHLSPHTIFNNYKRIVKSIGLPDARFHDLRHSYAVAAIQKRGRHQNRARQPRPRNGVFHAGYLRPRHRENEA